MEPHASLGVCHNVERAFFLTESNSSEGHVQPGPDTDEELMELCAGGSEHAYNLLVGRYKGRVVNLVFRFIGDPERAQEIALRIGLALVLLPFVFVTFNDGRRIFDRLIGLG